MLAKHVLYFLAANVSKHVEEIANSNVHHCKCEGSCINKDTKTIEILLCEIMKLPIVI